MLRILMMAVVSMMTTLIVHAQIEPQVIEVLKKSQEKMSSPDGTEMEMTVDVTLMVKLTGMKIKCSEKGNKLRLNMESKVMGQEVMVETGFDGYQEWRYIHRKDKDDKAMRDTLTIIKTTKKPKNEHSVNFDVYKDYKTAKIKIDGKYYAITLTRPVEKDSPSKMVMLIDKDNYRFHEMKTKVKGITMTMRMTKFKYGVNDDVFVLDMKQYPNAVVVRK